MLNQKIRLRAESQYIIPKIQTVQGDTGRVLVCEIEDFEIPGGATATFWAMKPSGKSVQNDAPISDQEIMVELTNQTLAERGYIQCQIEIKADGKSVKTFAFCLDNGKSLTGDWPKSENENTYLEGVVAEMQAKLTETINQANAATSEANTATQNANTATDNANAAADEARQTIWNNKNLTNNTSAAESKVETAAGAAVLTGVDGKTLQDGVPTPDSSIPVQGVGGKTGDESFGFNAVTKSANMIDYSAWKKSSVSNGSGDFKDNGIVITSNESGDAYTSYTYSDVNSLKIPLKPNKQYCLSWEHSGSNGNVVIFPNGRTSGSASAQATQEKLVFTSTQETEFITFRVGVQLANQTATYKNIILNEGGEPVPYDDYFRSELPIALTQPLFDGDKIMQVKAGQTYMDEDGTIQTADRDIWGILRNNKIKKVQSTDVIFILDQMTNSKEFRIQNFGMIKYANFVKMYSNRFVKVSDSWNNDKVGIFSIAGSANEISFRLPVSEDKTWFDTHDTWVVIESQYKYFEPFTDQTPFFGWATPTGGCTITTDDPLEPIISADTAQTPEGSYLLTGYIDGLRARNAETVIAALSDQVVALTQKSMEG